MTAVLSLAGRLPQTPHRSQDDGRTHGGRDDADVHGVGCWATVRWRCQWIEAVTSGAVPGSGTGAGAGSGSGSGSGDRHSATGVGWPASGDR